MTDHDTDSVTAIAAFWIGVKDGWAQPHDLTMGITYDDWHGRFDLNEVYDRGVNLGQFLRSPLHNQRHIKRQADG